MITYEFCVQVLLALSLFAIVYGAYMIVSELKWYFKGAK